VTDARSVSALLNGATQRLRDSGSASPRLDAELLLGYILRTDRAGLLAHPDVALGPGQVRQFEESVARRATGEPVAYIRGIKEFYGFAFAIDNRALIPRPETEVLVDVALARISGLLVSAPRPAGTPPLLIADVGTGSGAIALSLALECRRRRYEGHVRFVAADVDERALSLARENGVAHAVADMVEFAHADLVPPSDRPYDLIVANLPYIPSAVVPELPIAASFEPAGALDGGSDGLAIIGRLFEVLPTELAPGRLALLEIGSDQPDRLRALAAQKLPGWPVSIHSDLGGQPRVAELERPQAVV
jgi:release factor glutamine methyltransferase